MTDKKVSAEKRSHPFMVLFVVDFHSIAYHFSDAELDRFARRLGEAGCDYVRMLSCWQKPGGRGSALPFEQNADRLADWNKPNPKWDANLMRAQSFLNKYDVGLWLDLFAQQYDRADYRWSPFRYNVNGFETWRATKPEVLGHLKLWIHRAQQALEGGKYLLGWGNELVHPQDHLGDTPKIDEWARAWVLPLANYMQKIGVPMPVPFSAGHWDGTGKSIYNRLCKQANPVWPWGDTFWVRHGIALAEHVDRDPVGSVLKHWGVSDDGVGLNPQNTVPPEKQGLTVNQTGRRSSHWTWRIEMVRHAKEVWGNRLRLVEVMPMELKYDLWHPDSLHQEESVDVFWRIAKEVYGVDIRRSFPLPPPPPPPPEPVYVWVEACVESWLLPNRYCKKRIEERFEVWDEPRETCELCKPSCSYWLKRWDFRRFFKCLFGWG